MIFVDAGAFFALQVPKDPHHSKAVEWLESNREPLVTSDYVAVETLNLLRARRQFAQAIEMNQRFLDEDFIYLEWVTPADYDEAAHVFSEFRDKSWSFTDCTSRVVMERLGISTAFGFDEHFRQFGTVALVPEINS